MGGCVGSRPATNDTRQPHIGSDCEGDKLIQRKSRTTSFKNERVQSNNTTADRSKNEKNDLLQILKWEDSFEGLLSFKDSSLCNRLLNECHKPTHPVSALRYFNISVDDLRTITCQLIKHINNVLDPILVSTLDRLRDDAERQSEGISVSEITVAVRQTIEKSLNISLSVFTEMMRFCLELINWVGSGVTYSHRPRDDDLPAGINRDLVVAGMLPSNFYVSSINHLMEAMRISLVLPSAGLLSQRQLEDGMSEMYELLLLFGVVVEPPSSHIGNSTRSDPSIQYPWIGTLPLLLFTATTKSSLLYIVSLFSQQRVSLNPLRRHLILKDAQNLLRMQSLWSGVPKTLFSGNNLAFNIQTSDGKGNKFFRLFPVFAGRGSNSVEHGEGHGPRKEFYDLCASLLTSSYSPENNLQNKYHAELSEGSRTIIVSDEPHYDSSDEDVELATAIPVWSLMLMTDSETSFEAELVQKPTIVDGKYHFVLSKPAPFSGKSIPVAVKTRNCSLFYSQSVSEGVWFHEIDPTLGTTTRPTQEQLSILQDYAFAGFLLGHAICNGVSMSFGLPVLFFKLLSCWPCKPKLEDTKLLSEALHESLVKILSMKDGEFKNLMSLEETPELTRSQYVDQKVDSLLYSGIKNQMTALVWGFRKTGIQTDQIFKSCTPNELQLIIQGRADDGISDFSVRDEYKVIEAEEFSDHSYNKIFADILWQVIDSGFGAEPEDVAQRKRKFLKFLTGRQNLPAHSKQECIYIVLPYTVFSAQAFDSYLYRLPVSHTCDNTLELPNYIESLIFGTDSPWYQQAGVEINTTITCSLKRHSWEQLTGDQQKDICEKLKKNLEDRLNIAIQNAESYELDFIEYPQNGEEPKPVMTIPSVVARNPQPDSDIENETSFRRSCSDVVRDSSEVAAIPLDDPEHVNRDDWDDDSPKNGHHTRMANPPTVVQNLLRREEPEQGTCRPQAEKSQFINISGSSQPDLTQPEFDANCDPWGTEDLDQLLEQFK